MNKERRKRIREAMEALDTAHNILIDVYDEEQEAFDNLPEGIQNGDRGEQMSEYIETINKMYESKDLVFYHIHDGIEFHGEDYILQDAPHERNTKDFDFLTYELTFKEVIRISGKQKANPSNSENSGFRNFGFILPSEDNSPNIYYLSASE